MGMELCSISTAILITQSNRVASFALAEIR
jgi:hypothetical protein